MAEARGRRLHWRTLERLTRMHEEELREGAFTHSEPLLGGGLPFVDAQAVRLLGSGLLRLTENNHTPPFA